MCEGTLQAADLATTRERVRPSDPRFARSMRRRRMSKAAQASAHVEPLACVRSGGSSRRLCCNPTSHVRRHHQVLGAKAPPPSLSRRNSSDDLSDCPSSRLLAWGFGNPASDTHTAFFFGPSQGAAPPSCMNAMHHCDANNAPFESGACQRRATLVGGRWIPRFRSKPWMLVIPPLRLTSTVRLHHASGSRKSPVRMTLLGTLHRVTQAQGRTMQAPLETVSTESPQR